VGADPEHAAREWVAENVLQTWQARCPQVGPSEATLAVDSTAAALDANIDARYREFEAGRLTLLHGDSHLGNTYSLPDGRSGLLDLQVIWRGTGPT
jgi:Ser/Thr protein kinase RdoA (MazF antagonist)